MCDNLFLRYDITDYNSYLNFLNNNKPTPDMIDCAYDRYGSYLMKSDCERTFKTQDISTVNKLQEIINRIDNDPLLTQVDKKSIKHFYNKCNKKFYNLKNKIPSILNPTFVEETGDCEEGTHWRRGYTNSNGNQISGSCVRNQVRCKKGQIRRKSYTRQNGTKVKASCYKRKRKRKSKSKRNRKSKRRSFL